MSAVATGTFVEQGKTFASVAKKFKPRDSHVLAVKHVGTPSQYPTEHGTEMAYDGDYVVQVGAVDKTEHVPPRVDATGKRIPGETRTVKEPLLEVMKAQDFEKLYEA